MPNHITNRVRFMGAADDLTSCIESLAGPEGSLISFQRLIPIPEHVYCGDVSKTEEWLFGEPLTALQWCRENWRTKWDAYDVGAWTRGEGWAELAFDTAWSPPSPVLLVIAKRNPALRIEHAFCCEGSNFCGLSVYQGGNYTSAESVLYLARERTFIRPGSPTQEQLYERVYLRKPERDDE